MLLHAGLALMVALSGAQTRLERKVRTLCAARDNAPTAADWRGLGDGVDAALAAAAEDARALNGVRACALAGLGAVGGQRARVLLTRFCEDDALPPDLRAQAVVALAAGFARSDPDQVMRIAKRLLAESDWLLRRGAARALGHVGSEPAKQALRAQLLRETHAAVRAACEKALAQ
jgi:HEAT repeat protein